MPGANRLDQLIASWSPRMRAAFLQGIQKLRDAAQVDVIVTMLEKGDIDGAVRAVGLDPVNFRALDLTIMQAFEDGGRFAADVIPVLRGLDGLAVVARFDVRNPRAEAWLKDHSATLVTNIVADQQAMIRTALTASVAKGENPRASVLDLVGRLNKATGKREGGVIGLTDSQEQWTLNYAAELDTADPAALTRALRDRRFDKTVQKAIRDGSPIPADVKAKMVANYRNRALAYRAESIARTETATAVHQAQSEAMQQAIDKGIVQESAVKKIWHTVRDDRVRETHREMEGEKVAFRDSFVSPSGARLRFPGDPLAPASERVNCRCFVQQIVERVAIAA